MGPSDCGAWFCVAASPLGLWAACCLWPEIQRGVLKPWGSYPRPCTQSVTLPSGH